VVAGDLGGRAVVALAIDLDDHPLLGPECVNCHTAHPDVHLRDRQPGRLAQLEHPPLELRPREAQLGQMFGERSDQGVAPRPSTTRDALDRLDVQQPSEVGVRKRVSDAAK
jgi:hypothetical protein